MGKIKPGWQKTLIPMEHKITLWRIMKDNPTQTAREQAVAHLDLTNERARFLHISRDEFKALGQEIMAMPIEQVNLLPEDLKIWIISLRPNIEDWPKHYAELSETAKNLSAKFRHLHRYYPPTDEEIGALAVNYDDKDFLEMIDDPSARYLLSHIQADLPLLKNLKTWAYLKTKDISEDLLTALSMISRHERVRGKCEICKDWFK